MNTQTTSECGHKPLEHVVGNGFMTSPGMGTSDRICMAGGFGKGREGMHPLQESETFVGDDAGRPCCGMQAGKHLERSRVLGNAWSLSVEW